MSIENLENNTIENRTTPTKEVVVIGSTEDYRREGSLDYPGKRPETDYITDGETVYSLDGEGESLLESIDTFLSENNLQTLDQRIPVLAYGANASPGSLRDKFSKSKYNLQHAPITEKELQTTPCIFVELEDMNVVWHGVPGQKGGYFAELYGGEEVKGTKVQAIVQFLTVEQLAMMHTSEGVTYEFATIGSVDSGKGFMVDNVLSYVARESNILLDETGRPVSVAGVKRSGSDLHEWDVRGALDYTLGLPEVVGAIGEKTADEYIEIASEKRLADRKAQQKIVQEAMQAAGATRSMRFPIENEAIYTSGGYSNLPKFRQPGAPLKNTDGSAAIGYVEFAALDNLRIPEEHRRAIEERILAENPSLSPEEVAKKVDPVLYSLGARATGDAEYYIGREE